ncbi:hypothetical protein D3C78_952170 [compost metagenome]
MQAMNRLYVFDALAGYSGPAKIKAGSLDSHMSTLTTRENDMFAIDIFLNVDILVSLAEHIFDIKKWPSDPGMNMAIKYIW